MQKKRTSLITCLASIFITLVLCIPTFGYAKSIDVDRDSQFYLIHQISQQIPILDAPLINYYINDLGAKVLNAQGFDSDRYQFVVIDKDSINAFATPLNVIALNTGLILEADSEDQLAAVIAHEIAHIEQEHFQRRQKAQSGKSLQTLASIFASALIASHDSEAGTAAFMSTVASQQQAKLSFSREQEQEADRIGQQYLQNTEYHPDAMYQFLAKLQNQHADGNNIEFLLTHPLPATRLGDNFSLRPSIVDQSPRSDALSLVKQYLGLTQKTQDIVQLSKTQQAFVELTQHLQAKRYSQATETLQPYLALRSTDPLFLLASIELNQKTNNYQDNIDLLETWIKREPDSELFISLLAQSLMQNDQAVLAYEKLNQWNSFPNYRPGLAKVHAEAAFKSGYKAKSHELLANYYLTIKALPLAKEQVQLGLANVDSSITVKARLRKLQTDLNKAKL